jgi:hypothetical protein
MTAFRVESWIWYSVVILMVLARMYGALLTKIDLKVLMRVQWCAMEPFQISSKAAN